MKLAIVLLNYNGWEDTRKCLSSLSALQTGDLNTYLIDNGSIDDQSESILSSFPFVRFHKNSTNRGFAGGNNDGIKMAIAEGADIVFLLNNDAVVAPEVIEELKLAFKQNPQYGIIGPVINYMDEPDSVMTDACMFNLPNNQGFFVRIPVPIIRGDTAITPCDIVNGCAMAVRRPVLEKIGFLDESLFIVHEEADFCLRARKKGFGCGVINKILVWHKGSNSFRRSGKEYQRYYDSRNLFPLLLRHGQINGRKTRHSLNEYFRYVYYRYCHEIESGNSAAAFACAEGLYDALLHRMGPRVNGRKSLGARSIAAVFSAIHQVKTERTPAEESISRN
jgi:GT2 family glycosyltransferase